MRLLISRRYALDNRRQRRVTAKLKLQRVDRNRVSCGVPVADLPFAIVALRDGDLAYSHVHPLPTGAPGEIVFHTELPTAGRYRLFFQFKIGGVVHTAPFTVDVQR